METFKLDNNSLHLKSTSEVNAVYQYLLLLTDFVDLEIFNVSNSHVRKKLVIKAHNIC